MEGYTPCFYISQLYTLSDPNYLHISNYPEFLNYNQKLIILSLYNILNLDLFKNNFDIKF